MNHDSIAVATLSDSSVIENRGTTSAEETAVTLGGIATGTKSTLINSALIEAGTSTILIQGTEDVYLRNSGVIKSDSSAYDGHQSIGVITNSGQIWGNLNLSHGEDRYTGTTGSLLAQAICRLLWANTPSSSIS